MAKKESYGKYIYEYLIDIHNEFDGLQIRTVSDLRNELESRVRDYLLTKYPPTKANQILSKFIGNTRDQQCTKVIVNDFKRLNFGGDEKFNLFYYSEEQYKKGFVKRQVRDQETLRIAKYDSNNPPEGVTVYHKHSDKE